MDQKQLLRLLESNLRKDLRSKLGNEDYDRISVPAEIENFLSEVPKLKENVGRLINYGNLVTTFTIRPVSEALISRALDYGQDAAVGFLSNFLSEDFCSCVEVCLLDGVNVRQRYELMEGIYISPLSEVPSDSLRHLIDTFPRINTASPMSKSFSASYLKSPQLPACAIYRVFKAVPKYFDNLEERKGEKADEGMGILAKIAGLLTILGPCSPIIRRSYCNLASDSFISGFVGSTWGSPYEETKVRSCYMVSCEELASFKLVLDSYLAMREAERKKLDVPLHRLNEAVRHRTPMDRAIDIGIALESLLVGGKEIDYINQTIQNRGAWLLGKDPADRKRISGLLKKLYKARSNSVHSGEVNPEGKLKNVDEILTEGLSLCSGLIRAVINRKGMDWDSWENVRKRT